jgi:hypothetical protein
MQHVDLPWQLLRICCELLRGRATIRLVDGLLGLLVSFGALIPDSRKNRGRYVQGTDAVAREPPPTAAARTPRQPAPVAQRPQAGQEQRLSSLSNTHDGPASSAPEPFLRTGRHWIPITVVVLTAVAVFAVVAWAVSGRNFTNQTGTQMSPGADQHRDTAGPRVLTGTMDDWIGAVCFAGLVADGGTGFFLPGAADGRNCASAHAGRDASVPNPEAVNRFPIFIGAYGSPSARANDLKPRLAGAARIGPYAEGVDSASGESSCLRSARTRHLQVTL